MKNGINLFVVHEEGRDADGKSFCRDTVLASFGGLAQGERRSESILTGHSTYHMSAYMGEDGKMYSRFFVA